MFKRKGILALIMLLSVLISRSYAVDTSMKKLKINSIYWNNKEWHISYIDVKSADNLGNEELFVDGVSNRFANGGSKVAGKREFTLHGGPYSKYVCHQAYIVIYDKHHNIVNKSNVFKFGNLDSCRKNNNTTTSIKSSRVVAVVNSTVSQQNTTPNTTPKIVNLTSKHPLKSGSYYVSLSGNDNNNGRSLGKAFKSIKKALSVSNGGDTILVKGGTYREGEIRVLKTNNTGKYITLKNYGNEKVTIKGSVVVKNWEHYKGNIWKLPSSNESGLNRKVHYQQVFYGEGQNLQKIGYPNYFKRNGIPEWNLFLKRFFPIKRNKRNPFGMSEGTFYVKKLEDGTFDLYVWLPKGKNPNAAGTTMEVSDKTYLINAYDVKNMKFQGLHFKHTSASSYARFNNGFQVGYGLKVGYGAIVDNCEISYTDFSGLNLSLGKEARATDMKQVVSNCKIHHNGDIGMTVTAGGYVIRNSEFYENGTRPFFQPWHSGAIKTSAQGWGEIKDNYIHDERAEGIWFDHCYSGKPILIHHNYLDNIGNLKRNSLRTLAERGHGLFFEQSKNIKAYNNIINNTKQRGIYVSTSEDTTISNNLIRRSNLAHIGVGYSVDRKLRLKNLKIFNNILMDKRGEGNDIKVFPNFGKKIPFYSSNEFKNNIIYNESGKYRIVKADSNWSTSANLTGVNPMLLKNGSSRLDRWSLDSQSPAIDASTRFSYIKNDFKYKSRNNGQSDIGPFER